MKSLTNSLSFRIGISIILVEILALGGVALAYYYNFANQIDERLESKLVTAGRLITSSNLSLSTLADREVMTILVGEEIVDALVIRNGSVVFSLDPKLRNQPAESIPGISSTLLESTEAEIVQRVTINNRELLTGVFNTSAIKVVFRTDISQSNIEKQQLLGLLAIGTLITIVATSIIIFISFNSSVLRQINNLVSVLTAVENGDLTVRVETTDRKDEIGVLQNRVNSMITRLSDLFNTLEQRITDRTRDLQIASDVARDITTILDENQLLNQVTQRTKDGFGLYHVGVFTFDANTDELTLRSGSNPASETSFDRKFNINDKGVVPNSAKSRELVLVNDVKDSDIHAFNNLLPDTSSELALPMIIMNQLVGVLDLQSTKVDGFDDADIRALKTLAEQIAIAIQNAKLFSEAEAARKQAETSAQVKSAFLASMSHELRTPLNAIINFTRFVAKGDVGPVTEAQEQMLNDVVSSAKHLLNLINDVLDMSKIESGSLNLFISDDLDLQDVFKHVLSTANVLLMDKESVTLQSSIADDLPSIRADRQRITQVLLNIISNACKFTEEGSIQVNAKQDGVDVLISVQDTGPGIAEEDVDSVFEPFKQTSAGIRQGGGTGLGMPISKNIVEAHGGRLWLESQPEKGSIFYISLPIQPELLTTIK